LDRVTSKGTAREKGALGRNVRAISPRARAGLGLTSSGEQVDDKNDEEHAANPAAHHRAAVVISAAPAKQEQQDENDQNEVHEPPIRT